MGFRIKFGADTSAFEMGVDKMKGKTKELGSGLNKVKKVGASIGAVFAGGAIIAGLEKMSEKIKELNRSAQLFDTTTQSVQRLSRVAEENGLVFEDIADAIHDATERAQDGINGNKTYAGVFQEHGDFYGGVSTSRR